MIYRMSQEKCASLREGVPYVKLYRYNPKHLCPKLNGYGDIVILRASHDVLRFIAVLSVICIFVCTCLLSVLCICVCTMFIVFVLCLCVCTMFII